MALSIASRQPSSSLRSRSNLSSWSCSSSSVMRSMAFCRWLIGVGARTDRDRQQHQGRGDSHRAACGDRSHGRPDASRGARRCRLRRERTWPWQTIALGSVNQAPWTPPATALDVIGFTRPLPTCAATLAGTTIR